MTDHVFSTDMAIASQEWLESLSEEDRALVDEAIQPPMSTTEITIFPRTKLFWKSSLLNTAPRSLIPMTR